MLIVGVLYWRSSPDAADVLHVTNRTICCTEQGTAPKTIKIRALVAV